MQKRKEKEKDILYKNNLKVCKCIDHNFNFTHFIFHCLLLF